MGTRSYDPTQAGGPVRKLSTLRIRITPRGIARVAEHVGRFGEDRPNDVMIGRLARVVRGEVAPTAFDLNYSAHELREFVRYRRLGFRAGAGDDYDLWNNAHSATLEDYRLDELDADGSRNLFHPEAWGDH